MAVRNHPIERVHPPRLLMKLVNPLMRMLARSREGVQRFVLVLHYRGKKTGRHYDLPVGYRLIEGRILLLTDSAWRHNFRGGQEIEVTFRGRRQPATVTLIDDPGVVAHLYQRRFGEVDRNRARRDLGVRVSLDRTPTREEWLELIKREGMSIVEVALKEPPVLL